MSRSLSSKDQAIVTWTFSSDTPFERQLFQFQAVSHLEHTEMVTENFTLQSCQKADSEKRNFMACRLVQGLCK